MPKASDFVETEATSGEVPQTSDTPRAANRLCPLCSHETGEMVVTARLPVQRPDGMWGHYFLPVHPYCAHMYEQGYTRP